MDTSNLAPATDDADEKRIRELVARTQEAQADPDVLPALHTSDLVLINLGGRRLFGRETFVSAMTEALSSPLKDIRTTLEIDDIRFATPDVAIVSLTKTVHDERAEGDEGDDLPELPLTGAMTYVMTRTDGDWRISLAQTTPIR
ncbi:SgcJ/EcaC family oxidoreductase [Streptomyces pratensis]|uniref:SgcJ/EcaC family oxidoreductase n=1 Tax=Streptomyces pratensis TaxID=1169025 RepID=UPI0019317D98|nr:SgcJ/EcaC family oxidoreductase [Streptomyces pratensis]